MAKRLTQGISFFTTDEMFEKVRQSSEQREISVSQLIRGLIRDFLRSEDTPGVKEVGGASDGKQRREVSCNDKR